MTETPPQGFITEDKLTELDEAYGSSPTFVEFIADCTTPEAQWTQATDLLQEAREAAGEETVQGVLDALIQAVAIETGAIEQLYEVREGLTLTVMTGASFADVMTHFDEDGIDHAAFFEAQRDGYQLALDVATAARPIGTSLIKEMHATICAPQETYRVLTVAGWQDQELPKGVFKDRPNHVQEADGSFHAYCPPLRVAEEMEGFVDQLAGDEFASSHPILQAAYAHYGIVGVHPFSDGNGRVARALCSTYLFRAESVPHLVLADRRDAYLAAIRAQDRGETQTYLDFFANAALGTLATVRDLLTRPSKTRRRLSVAAVRDAYRSHEGLTHMELDRIALNLHAMAYKALKEFGDELGLPAEIDLNLQQQKQQKAPSDDNYRRPVGAVNCVTHVALSSKNPFAADVRTEIEALVLKDGNRGLDEVLLYSAHPEYRMGFAVTDLYPTPAVQVEVRLSAWAERLCVGLLESLLPLVERKRQETGL